MNPILQIAWYTIRDVTRNRWGISYAGFFAVVTLGLLVLQVHSEKVAVSLMSICLFLIPLVSLLFGTIYLYHSREFIELVLTQPIRRSAVLGGMFMGLAGSLVAAFVLGIGLPFLLLLTELVKQLSSLLLLVATGTLLTVIFLALSFLSAISIDDRGKGVAVALGLWLLAALVYDGVVLLLAMQFSDYPLELPLLIASLLNPIDLARVLLLLQSDWAALMGYTGAVFKRLLGSKLGLAAAFVSLAIWTVLPLLRAQRVFRQKDF